MKKISFREYYYLKKKCTKCLKKIGFDYRDISKLLREVSVDYDGFARNRGFRDNNHLVKTMGLCNVENSQAMKEFRVWENKFFNPESKLKKDSLEKLIGKCLSL